VRHRWQWAVAGVAAVVALTVRSALGGTWHIALAGVGASLLGVWLAPTPVEAPPEPGAPRS